MVISGIPLGLFCKGCTSRTSLVGYASDRLIGDGSVVRLAGRRRRSNLRGRHGQLVGVLARRRHQHLVLFCNNKHQNIMPLCNNKHQHTVPLCNNNHNVHFCKQHPGVFCCDKQERCCALCKTITKTNIICSLICCNNDNNNKHFALFCNKAYIPTDGHTLGFV